jgi:hypothetical protein
MSNRDFAVGALGRFLVVERYRETCLSSLTDEVRVPARPGPARYADKPDSRSGSQAPARPQHG